MFRNDLIANVWFYEFCLVNLVMSQQSYSRNLLEEEFFVYCSLDQRGSWTTGLKKLLKIKVAKKSSSTCVVEVHSKLVGGFNPIEKIVKMGILPK